MEVDGMTYTLIMDGEQPVGGMFDMGDDPEFDKAPVNGSVMSRSRILMQHARRLKLVVAWS